MKAFSFTMLNKKSTYTLCALLAVSQWGNAAESITEAFTSATVKLNLRLRYEDVDTPAADADLTSLKTRLTYTTDSFKGFSTLLEMDDVTHFSNFEGLVADPEGTEVNQIFLSYTNGGNNIKYGRQRILLDNQRFVGGVGFRQNEQTYDALSYKNTSVDKLEVFVAGVYNVNRIFGEAVATGDHANDTILFNTKYAGWDIGTLSGYAYLIDNEDAIGMSSDTLGVRFAGKSGLFSYAAEIATQSDGADNPADYDATYLLAEGGVKAGPVNLSLGYEVLGADGSNGQFITPFATLHAFQGWTDVFLGGGTGNVAGGIEDIYFKAAWSVVGMNFLVKYHQFGPDDSTAAGVSDYGSEIGFQIAKNWDNYGLSLKYADYSEDGFAADKTILWLTATADF